MTRTAPVVLAALSACLVLAPVAAHARLQSFSVAATPALWPGFDPSRPDHVVRCDPATPVQIRVSAPEGTRVGIGRHQPRGGSFTVPVPLVPGRAVTVVVDRPGRGGRQVSHVRCLPADLPAWTAQQLGRTEAQWYVLSTLQSHYVYVVDAEGVPVWWTDTHVTPADAKLLVSGDLLYASVRDVRQVRLDGSTVVRLDSPPGTHDHHEVLRLANGDYLLMQYAPVASVDLSAWGQTSGPIVDAGLQRQRPDGTVVWSWSALAHIPLSEVPQVWRRPDAYHVNSAEESASTFVLSFRHLNAVYGIDAVTGAVRWKLGGTPRPESLRVVGDPVFDAGGTIFATHDARVLPDGTLTLHDNGTTTGRPPRALRYRLDLVSRTATLLEQVTDPAAPVSLCCGSARRLPGGNWVMAWGGTTQVAELTATGRPVFRMVTTGFTYRATPVLPGVVSREALRQGMDAQAG